MDGDWVLVLAVLWFIGWGFIVLSVPEHREKLVLDLTPLMWGVTALLFFLAKVMKDT